MSTILRALQRVEGEKRVEEEKGRDREMEGLREGLVPRGEPLVPPGRPRWQIGLTAFLTLLVLGFFLWWLIPTEEVGEPSATSPPVIAAPPERRSESLPRPARRASGKPEIAAARPDASAQQLGVRRPSQPVAAPPPPVPEKAAVAPPPPPAEKPARRPIEEPAVQLPPPIAKPPPPPEEVAAAPPPPPIEKAAVQPPPPVAKSPAAERAIQPPPPIARPPVPKAPTPARVTTLAPPKVTVKKTVWHPIPERRVARIEVEGREGTLELHQGDAVGTLVISEIQPSGVVFLHGGEKLRRKVGGGR